MDKIERYNWERLDDKGIEARLPIGDLLIDHEYQRPEVSNLNTLNIAHNFSWSAFGALIVMKRQDGKYYVVDGQQRLLAARKRGDIKTVPCRVTESNGIEHEARVFARANIHRTRVNAYSNYRAMVAGREEPAFTINKWCCDNGFVVTENTNAGQIDFPALLVKCWSQNSEICKKAILLQRSIINPEQLNSYVHKGLFYLLLRQIDVESELGKLITLGGKAAIMRSIKTIEIETGQKASSRISALGILAVINFKRRKRLFLPSESNGDKY
jgi:hypothetical protein